MNTGSTKSKGAFFRLRRALFPERIDQHSRYTRLFRGATGLEIGGPSKIFSRRGLIPLYPILKQVDGCNFAPETVWEGRIEAGTGKYRYDKRKTGGYQYIRDAVSLDCIESEQYDIVLSSHCLEHVANPLRALVEWRRVLKQGGHLVLVLPHKDGTFDHKRPVTTLRHLIEDFERSVGEDDLTHLSEILELHDLSMDPPAGDKEAFRQRSLKNRENRCLHHHVFDTDLAVRLIDHSKLQIIDVQQAMPYHVIIIAWKSEALNIHDNGEFLSKNAAYRSRSPFPSDAVCENS